MPSKLWEKFERTALKPDIDSGQSGSPARLELRRERNFHNTIDAIIALRECGLTLLDAKRRIERLMEDGILVVDLPFVPDVNVLIARIERDGAIARLLAPIPAE